MLVGNKKIWKIIIRGNWNNFILIVIINEYKVISLSY